MNTISSCLIAFLFAFSFSSKAQDAESFVRSAMQRSGNWQQISTIRYKTTGKNYNKWQNYSFTHPKPTTDEALRSFDLRANVYYSKTIARYGGGYIFEFVNIGKDTTRYVYDALKSRTGLQLQKGGKKIFDAGFLWLNETFPFYALQTVLQSGDTLQLRNDSTVRRILKAGYEDFVFSPAQQLTRITRVQNAQTTEKIFSDYKTSGLLSYPQTASLYINKELARIDAIEEFLVNEVFNTTLLQIPSEYKYIAPVATAMKVSKIKKDVFLIENVPGGRNVLFVNMNNYLVVTECPVSTEVSQSIIELIKKTVPGKKIGYVHLSHFHNDHSNGIKAFAAAGATLIATAPTVAAMQTLVDTPSALKKSVFSKQYTLKDSNHEIRFYEIKNSHAEGMSFLYLPAEKIIYEGDLYSLPDDGTITPAIEITRDFEKFIRDKNLQVERIIGHHGHSNISLTTLKEAVGGNTAATQSAQLSTAFVLQDHPAVIEGMTYDPIGGNFYFGESLSKKILRYTKDGKPAGFIDAKSHGMTSVLGMTVSRSHQLWICGAVTENGKKIRTMFQYDLKTGNLAHLYRDTSGKSRLFNDVAITADGSVYCTDTYDGALYKMDTVNRVAVLYMKNDSLFDGNGISAHGNVLYISTAKGITRVDTRTRKISITGLENFLLAGYDGLYYYDHTLIGIQNVFYPIAIVRYHLDAEGYNIIKAETLAAGHPLTNIPTTGAIVGNEFYFMGNNNITGDAPPGAQKKEPVRKPVTVVRLTLGR